MQRLKYMSWMKKSDSWNWRLLRSKGRFMWPRNCCRSRGPWMPMSQCSRFRWERAHETLPGTICFPPLHYWSVGCMFLHVHQAMLLLEPVRTHEFCGLVENAMEHGCRAELQRSFPHEASSAFLGTHTLPNLDSSSAFSQLKTYVISLPPA